MMMKTQAPTEADVDQAVAIGGEAIDAAVKAATPNASFSVPRLNAFAQAVAQTFSILDPGDQGLAGFKAVPPKPGAGVPIPRAVVERYLALVAAFQAYQAGMDEYESDEELPDLSTIMDDGALALAATQLVRLAKDKEFLRWAKTQRETPVVPPTEQAPAQPVAKASSGNADLDMLFGGG